MHTLWLLFSRSPSARWERSLIKATLFRHWSAFRRGLSLDALIWAVRTDVTSAKVAKDSDVTLAGTAVDIANGMRVLFNKGRKTLIVVTNTAAATKVVTVRKATNSQDIPAADYSSIAIPITTGVQILGPFSARYTQADGGIWLDFVAGHTGSVHAIEIPS